MLPAGLSGRRGRCGAGSESAVKPTARDLPRKAGIWATAGASLLMYASLPLVVHSGAAAPQGAQLRVGYYWLWLLLPAVVTAAVFLVPLRELSKWSAARARLERVLAAALGWLDRDDVVLFYAPDWLYYVAPDRARCGGLEVVVQRNRERVSVTWVKLDPALDPCTVPARQFAGLSRVDVLGEIEKKLGHPLRWRVAPPRRCLGIFASNQTLAVQICGPDFEQSIGHVGALLAEHLEDLECCRPN